MAMMNVIEKRKHGTSTILSADGRHAVICQAKDGWQVQVDGGEPDTLCDKETAEAQAIAAFIGIDSAVEGRYRIDDVTDKAPAEQAAELLSCHPELENTEFTKAISEEIAIDAGSGHIFAPLGRLCLVFEIQCEQGTVHPIGTYHDTEQRHDFDGQSFTHKELWAAIHALEDDETDWLGRKIQRGMLAMERLNLAQCAAQAVYTAQHGQPPQ